MILSVKRQEGTSCHNIAFFTIAQQVAPVNHFFDIFLIFSNNCNSHYFVTVNGANSNAISSGFYCFLRGYDLNIHFLQNDCLYNC